MKIRKNGIRTTCDHCGGIYETFEIVEPKLDSQEANEAFQKLIPYDGPDTNLI